MKRKKLLVAPPRHLVRKHMSNYMRGCTAVGRVFLKTTKKWTELYELPGGPYNSYGILEQNGNCQINPKSWYKNYKIHPIAEDDEPRNLRIKLSLLPGPRGITRVQVMPVGWRPTLPKKVLERVPLKRTKKKPGLKRRKLSYA